MVNECIQNEIYSTIANLESSIKGEIDSAYNLICHVIQLNVSINNDLKK